MKFAVIDLGTNSIRLYLYEVSARGKLQVLVNRKDMVQLGEDLFRNGYITDKAWARTLTTLKEYSKIIKNEQIDTVQAIATCAMREAKNGTELRDIALKETGIFLEIISGAEEAELIATGVINNMLDTPDNLVLVDIGGGSTEVSLIAERKVIHSVSLALGAVRCQENELQGFSPPTAEGEKMLRQNIMEASKEFKNFLEQQDKVKHIKAKHIVGSSGSARAIHKLVKEQINLNKKEDTTWHKTFYITEILSTLRVMSQKQLEKKFDFEPRRAQVIFAAGVILDQLCTSLSIEEFTAVPYGLKDGIVAKLIA